MIQKIRLLSVVSTKTIFVLWLFGISLLLSTVIPPFQSPDEFEHITRAYLLGNGDIVLKAPAGQSSGGMIDAGLARYMDAYSSLPFNSTKKLSAHEIEAAKTIQWQGVKEYRPALGMAYYFPGIYVVHTLGLKTGEFLKLSVDASYQLTRVLLFIAIGLILYYSFSLYAPSYLTLTLLMIPMSIFQFSSASLDGLASAIAIFIISAVLKILDTTDDWSLNTATNAQPSGWRVTHPQLFYFVVFAYLLLATSRLQAMSMLLLVGAAAYALKHKRYFLITGFAAVAVILWQIVIIRTIVDGRVALGASSSTIILYYLNQPAEFFSVLRNTLTNTDILRGYFSSFFGMLGWLDTPFKGKEYVYLSYITLAIAACSINYPKFTKLRVLKATILALTAFGSLAAVFLALLVTWTPHPALVIDGVVGRYLLIPALLLSYSFTSCRRQVWTNVYAVGGLLLCTLGVYSTLITYKLLLDRYYLTP
ncbi:COG4713 Predicted membrane protein [Burkholderiaceae bacterium]